MKTNNSKWMKAIRMILVSASLCVVSCSPEKKHREYYADGTLRLEHGLTDNGIPDGDYLEFYPDGKKKVESPLKNGVMEGLRKDFYPNGLIKRTVSYKNNFPAGISKSYYQSGEIQSCKYWSQYYWHIQDTVYNGMLWSKDYNEEGSLIKQWHVVNVTSQKLSAKNHYKLKIELIGADYDKIDVFICEFDSLYRAAGSRCDTIRSGNLKAEYVYKAQKSGRNLIRGVIRDYRRETSASGGSNISESYAYFTYALNVE